MNNRTVHRGASARFLAVMASSTMVASGLIGISLAAPASASNNPAEVCEGYAAWARITANGESTSTEYSTDGITVSATGIPGVKGTWTSDPGAAAVYLHAGVGGSQSVGSGTNGTWEDDGDPQNALSTLTFCYDTPEPPDTSLIVNKKWVGINGTASEELAAKLGGGNAGPLKVKIDGDDVDNPSWGAPGISGLTEGDEVEIDEGAIPAVDSSLFPSGYTCEVVDNRPADDGDREESDLESRAIEESQYPQLPKPFDLEAGENVATVTNAVECTAIPVTPPPPGGSTPPPAEVTPPVEVTPVVEAAVASAPEAAAVAPAPATVSVPAAAKLPAAVPAGDGSEAPGLPLWALALMVVGLLGAGFSARSWAASRK